MSFSGQTGKRKVALGGKKRAEESREQLLKRTHDEREQRRVQKLEKSSALHIQTCWRRRRAAVAARAAVKARWQHWYGPQGEEVNSTELKLDSPYFRELCFFAREQDLELTARACQQLLHSNTGPGGFISSAEVHQSQASLLLLRAGRLAAICLRLLLFHRLALQHELAQPDQAGSTAGALVNTILALADSTSWRAITLSYREGAAAYVTSHLACNCDLFAALSQVAHCTPSVSLQQGHADRAVAHHLIQRLAQLSLALHSQRAVQHLPQLLFVPLIWDRSALQPVALLEYDELQMLKQMLQEFLVVPSGVPCGRVNARMAICRCPSLQQDAVDQQIWMQAVPALHALQARGELSAYLSSAAVVGGSGGACLCLLGNLAQLAQAALSNMEAVGATGHQHAGTVSSGSLVHLFILVVQQLLQLAPIHAAFSYATAMDTGESDDEEILSSSAHRTPAANLSWEGPEPVPEGLAAQLRHVSQALVPLVRAVLPVCSPASQSQGSPGAGQRVGDLCALLQQLLQAEPLRHACLITLTTSAELVPRLWFSYLKSAHRAGAWEPRGDATADPGWMLPLVVLSPAFSTSLATAGDEELYTRQRPLPPQELYNSRDGGLLSLLKFAMWQNLWVEASAPQQAAPAEALRASLRRSVGALLGQLYDRNTRRSFAPVAAFHAEGLPKGQLQGPVAASQAAGLLMSGSTHGRVANILRHAPFMVSFEERAAVFQSVMAANRAEHNSNTRLQAPFEPSSFVTIRRDHLLEDGFEGLHRMRDELKGRVRIAFVDAFGTHEAGVDGGGLFKDFMEGLVREGFDPQRGLFKATSNNCLYPNPDARHVEPHALAYFEFLGRMVGKALYEGILVELPLAGFFLKKLLRRGCDVNDLPTLDPELYRHLMLLREMSDPAAVDALSLTFTVADSELDEHREVELVPGGRDRPVTAGNRVEYIHRVANHRLNVQIRGAAEAFRGGLELVVAREWTAMFNEGELQMLVAGGEGEGLDIGDLRAHVNYAGGYHEEHPVIHDLWEALAGFTREQQAAWLKFVTACSRAPLLGFAFLEPRLCVQMAGGVLDRAAQQRLPTSATCVNLLKLPPYQEPGVLRDKLLLAIRNAAGFDLS